MTTRNALEESRSGMPDQVNARLTPELNAEFDRWSTELGVERGTLARDIIKEALAARREGRASFERPEAPTPQDQTRFMAMLAEHNVELDRLLGALHRTGTDIR